MRDYHTDSEALEIICGDCAGAGNVTEADVRDMAALWARDGDPVSDDMIEAAVREAHRLYQ